MTKVIQAIVAQFGLPEYVVRTVVNSAYLRYKVYSIPKRNGKGVRIIAQPSKEVKALQRFVSSEILKGLPIHPAAMAYVEGKSIKLNAEAHVSQRYLLKMDFENFFPSIKPKDLKAHILQFMAGEFEADDINAICSICFWKPKRVPELELSIGGPSSPFISNTIMFEFDRQMSEYCLPLKVIYTRYADDLAFSSNVPNVLERVQEKVAEVIKGLLYPTITINIKKTVHTSKKHSRRITGLILSSTNEVSLGRERKRLLRAMVHAASLPSATQASFETIRGHLAFAFDIEPDFVARLRKKYGHQLFDRILRHGG